MKLLIPLLFIFMAIQLPAQINLVEKNDCDFTVDSLRIDFNRSNRLSTYFYKGERYTGCAKQDVPKNEMYYIHFIKDGLLERQLGFYYNGQKCRDYVFKNGYPHGVLRLFYPDGSLYIREEYENGTLHGSLKRWKEGKLVREANFWYGSMVSEKLYDPKTGKEIVGDKKKD